MTRELLTLHGRPALVRFVGYGWLRGLLRGERDIVDVPKIRLQAQRRLIRRLVLYHELVDVAAEWDLVAAGSQRDLVGTPFTLDRSGAAFEDIHHHSVPHIADSLEAAIPCLMSNRRLERKNQVLIGSGVEIVPLRIR